MQVLLSADLKIERIGQRPRRLVSPGSVCSYSNTARVCQQQPSSLALRSALKVVDRAQFEDAGQLI